MEIEAISRENLPELTRLALALWPECDYEEEYRNGLRILQSDKETCALMKHESEYIGFIYLSIRMDYVEGTTIPPVAYIEGLYVNPAYRRAGVAKQLVGFGEKWGQTMGCKQYASDTEWHNHESIAFHKRVGFEEVNRTVCFVKEIQSNLEEGA